MNDIISQSQKSNPQTLDARFAAIESTLAALKDHILEQNPPGKVTPSSQRKVHLDHTRAMLVRRGETTVSELRKVLGVSVKTATRLMRALSQTREGHLFFEPHGSTERLVLLHPSRVVLDRGPRSPVN